MFRRILVIVALLLVSLGLQTVPLRRKPPRAPLADLRRRLQPAGVRRRGTGDPRRYYPNKYIWEDTHLTVAVQAAPNVSTEHVEAVRGAIETWDAILRESFDDR